MIETEGGNMSGLGGSITGISNQAKTLKNDIQAYFLMNQFDARTNLGKDAANIIKDQDIPKLNTVLYNRIAYRESIIEGKGVTEFRDPDIVFFRFVYYLEKILPRHFSKSNELPGSDLARWRPMEVQLKRTSRSGNILQYVVKEHQAPTIALKKRG